MLDKISEGTKFYHPLPRPKFNPEIPTFLDTLPLNGWEEQAINGYYVRIVLLSMLGGALEAPFDTSRPQQQEDEDFIIPAPITDGTKGVLKEGKRGIKPIENGTVIDHIAKGKSQEEIYNTIVKIRKILKLYDVDSADGIFKSADGSYKGYISLPDRYLSFKEIKKLSAISPNTTVNIIKNSRVVEKYRIKMPPRIYGFDEIRCKNENCITNPAHGENVTASFVQVDGKFVCEYCETPHEYHEIWKYKYDKMTKPPRRGLCCWFLEFPDYPNTFAIIFASSTKLSLRLAPPTSAPSMSGLTNSPKKFSGVTLPP